MVIKMKEDLKTILYMGLGAISETGEKMQEITDSLYEKGKELYEKGVIKNEELKHNISKMMEEKECCCHSKCDHDCSCECDDSASSDNIVEFLQSLTKEEQKEIMDKMGWNCVDNEKGANN